MNFIKKAKDIIYRNLFDDELEIWHKLLNLILMALLLGTSLSLSICVIAKMNPIGNITMAMVLLVILFSLWLSNGRKNPKLAAIFVTALTNFILMPILYVYNGGLHSGMPIWQLMGLLFSWLVLKGKVGSIMFILNYSVTIGTIGFGMMYPEKIHPLGSDTLVAIDIAQSVFVATCIIGIIFKYNSYIYEKQRKHLMKQGQELRDAVEDAKKANQAKSDFLAHMSHEIRTPINSVLGMDEMILRETTEPEIAEYATNIQSAGHTLLSIINDILDFSKIESGKMEIIPSEYHMMSLLNDCYNLVAMRAKEKDIKIIFQNNESLPSKLYGDEVRIRQIILNLMTNGVKYTKEGSVKLSIDWERKNDDEMLLKISVTDTGSGISQENMNKLFKSFQRIEEKKNRNVEGTGLGLTITKQLIDLMNGTITVESEYGKGSTFYVEVPQAIVSEKPLGNFASKYVYNVTSGKEYKESFRAPKAKILVVDDVKMNIDVIKGLLKRTKVQIDAAESGKQCLELVKEVKYDIIFMDHMMPEMDGIETFHNIKNMQNHPNTDTPVIALTANALVGAAEEYKAEGFVDYLSKPVKGIDLENMVKKYLSKDIISIANEDAKTSIDRTDKQVADVIRDDRPLMERLDFLDTKMGVSYCAYSEEFYEEMLNAYAKSNTLEKIEGAYKAEDWNNYRINAHALKSTSRTIGAQIISDMAMHLETAAKQNDIEYIHKYHEKTMKAYKELLDKLKKIL